MCQSRNSNLIVLCLLLFISIWACSDDKEVLSSGNSTSKEIPIIFEVEVDDPLTRGSLLTVKDFMEYGLFGVTNKAFASNIYFWKEDGTWRQTKAISWPQTAASFFAVNASFAKTTAVTNTSKGPVYGVMQTVTVNATKQSFKYAVPDNAQNQFDLMVASTFNKTKNDNGGKVKLSFKRILSFLKFKIANKLEEGTVVTVGGISLYNLKNSGTFTFNKTKESTGTWAVGTTVDAMHRVFSEPFVLPTTSNWLVNQDTVFFSIPQDKTTKWKTTKTNNVPISEADANGHTYLKLLCKIQDEGGNYIFGSADSYGDVYMPFNLTTATKMATERVITITFSGGYDENGVPLSFGSDFDILVEDWDEAPATDPIEVEF